MAPRRTALIVGAGIGGLAATRRNGAAAVRHGRRVRAARTRKIVELARRNARMGSMSGAAGCWLRDQVIRFVPSSVILKSLVALGKAPAIPSVDR